jgi:hypothetical protein
MVSGRCIRIRDKQCLDILASKASNGFFTYTDVLNEGCNEGELLTKQKTCRPMKGEERKAIQASCRSIRLNSRTL